MKENFVQTRPVGIEVIFKGLVTPVALGQYGVATLLYVMLSNNTKDVSERLDEGKICPEHVNRHR